jgi:hypothetical protein
MRHKQNNPEINSKKVLIPWILIIGFTLFAGVFFSLLVNDSAPMSFTLPLLMFLLSAFFILSALREYKKMNKKNVLNIEGIILLAAFILCFALLLIIKL